MRIHRRKVLLIIGACVLLLGLGFLVRFFLLHRESLEQKQAEEALQTQIQTVIDARREAQQEEGAVEDVFGEDGIERLLLIGLDTRSGKTTGHCDAIQFLEINTQQQTVGITAIPRGTYVPLPGSGHIPGDYYVSNACAIGGLDYGITQMEALYGHTADHVVMIGFSGALGAFRLLDLPAMETLQWLRLRQAYAVGEPQRAHNHSTFLKTLLLKDLPRPSVEGLAWQYLLYRLVDTDLSFAQVRAIVEALSSMSLPEHPERVVLSMKPAYQVFDIPYVPETAGAYVADALVGITDHISEGAYTGMTEAEAQQRLMDTLNAGLADPAFVTQAFDQQVWLQVTDAGTRESVHFALLQAMCATLASVEEKQQLLADYIIEMQALHESVWEQAGRTLLSSVL